MNPWTQCMNGDMRKTMQVCGICHQPGVVVWVFGLHAQGMWTVQSSPFRGHEHGCGDFTHASCCRIAYPDGCVEGEAVPTHWCLEWQTLFRGAVCVEGSGA